MQKKTPSRLSAVQQRTLLVVVILGVFMVADTLYLLTNRLADALDDNKSRAIHQRNAQDIATAVYAPTTTPTATRTST